MNSMFLSLIDCEECNDLGFLLVERSQAGLHHSSVAFSFMQVVPRSCTVDAVDLNWKWSTPLERIIQGKISRMHSSFIFIASFT